MSMDLKTTEIRPAYDWVSAALLAILTIVLIWFGVYPNLLVNVIQSVS
jgi:NADH-quinone oxidoreductase subunit N